MIEDLARISAELGHTVNLKGGRIIVPGEEEYQQMLDKAAGVLYAEPEGATLRVGRLIVERRHNYFDVYIHVGTYK